jgi:hypothetical protein
MRIFEAPRIRRISRIFRQETKIQTLKIRTIRQIRGAFF